MFPMNWFDSSPELTIANVLDEEGSIAMWVRLIGDFPILWSQAGQDYNPDFLAIEMDGTHRIVEVKSDKDAKTIDVREKREAAMRWANHVSADGGAGEWSYVLLIEDDIRTAKGSWSALKRLGS